MPPKKRIRLSSKKKGRSKESVSENISLSDEDVSPEVKTTQGKKHNSGKKFLLGAVEKTKKIVGIGSSTIAKKTFQTNRMPTSTANSNLKASLNKNVVFENDVHTERDRPLKKVVDDACLSSSSSKSGECTSAVNTSLISSSREFSIVKEPMNNFLKLKISTEMSLTEISAEWSSCEEVDAIKTEIQNWFAHRWKIYALITDPT